MLRYKTVIVCFKWYKQNIACVAKGLSIGWIYIRYQSIRVYREQTRQRHLSSGGDDIASSYFAAQYGASSQQAQATVKQQVNETECSNSFVQVLSLSSFKKSKL